MPNRRARYDAPCSTPDCPDCDKSCPRESFELSSPSGFFQIHAHGLLEVRKADLIVAVSIHRYLQLQGFLSLFLRSQPDEKALSSIFDVTKNCLQGIHAGLIDYQIDDLVMKELKYIRRFSGVRHLKRTFV